MTNTTSPTRRKRPRPSLVFRAIADGTRREIIEHLADGPLTVRDIAARFPISRPAISRHLRLLKRAALVSARRAGRDRVYSATPAPLEEVDAWLTRYRLLWQAKLVALKEFVENPSPPTAEGETP